MMLKRCLLGISLFVSALASFGQTASFVPDQLLVQFRTGTDVGLFCRNFEATEGIPVSGFECLSPIAGMYRLKFNCDDCDLNHILQLLYNSNTVIAAQKNHYVTVRETISNDPMFGDLWHLKNDGSTGGTIDADIDATDAWDITTGGMTTHSDEIVVCVVEGGGVDITHNDLVDNIWHNTMETDDAVDNDGNGYVDDIDGWNVQDLNDDVGAGSHGTRVTGVIGAKGNNSLGISGVNWDVKLMIVKGQSASDEASVIAAYNYPLVMRKMYDESFGTKGAFVVATNSSWGMDNGDPEDAPLWCAMYDTLGAYGILSVAATTNSDSNVDIVGDLPTTCPSEYLISVTMTNSNDVRAGSGYGIVNIDLGAPGFAIKQTAPGNTYTTTNGTSFASPCVAGAIALAYSAPCADFINYAKFNPSLAALLMRDYILDNVDLLTALSSEVASGGRLNVNNAIEALLNDCDTNSCIAPYYLHLENLTDTSAEIAWEGFSGNYLFYIQQNSGPMIEIPVGASTSITFDTLIPCTNYTVYVQAICGADSSLLSYPLHFETDGCCYNPPLLLDYSVEDSLIVSWPPILYATQYNIQYREFGESTWNEFTDVSSPFTATSLEKCTWYEFQIYTLCDDSTHGYSESELFVTKGCGVCTEGDYCPISGGTDNQEWIDSLYLNTFVDSTGANGGWYVSEEIITALTPGESYTIRIVPGYLGVNFTENFNAWIDYDHSASFEPTEIVLNTSDNEAIIATISIPAGATIGITKMRIGMSALSEPEVCHSANFWGEFEDYCVYIGPQTGIEENQTEISVFPNPAGDELMITSNEVISSVQIFSQEGKLILSDDAPEVPLNVAQLAPGIYILRVGTVHGMHSTKFIKR
jgi:hypothetical protein